MKRNKRGKLTSEKNTQRIDRWKQNRQQAISVGMMSFIFLALLDVIVNTYTKVSNGWEKVALVFIICVVFTNGVIALMESARIFGYYKCLECEKIFVPSFINYVTGINLFMLRKMRCPNCGKEKWCIKVLSDDEDANYGD